MIALRRFQELPRLDRILVVTAVGLVIAMGVTQVGSVRNRRYVRDMTSHLWDFATQQESYRYDHAVYAASQSELAAFTASPNLTLTINEATRDGWSASASHRGSTVRCDLFVGTAAPIGHAREEGLIECG